MNRNKKKWIVALILLFAILVAACGNKEAENTNATTQPTVAGPSAEQKAREAYNAYLTQKPMHSNGTFLYKAGDCVIAILDNSVIATYKTLDEAKSKMADHTAKEVATDLFLMALTADPYFPAMPESQGVQNAIDRAYQLADLQWTPVGGVVPGVVYKDGAFTVISHEPGTTYQGVPYSGTTATDTYLGMNVSLVSFMSALKNPNSVLYTENLHSTNDKAASYFGTVCSKFVQHALGMHGSYNSQNMHKVPTVKVIASEGKYTVDKIKLGDIVVDPDVHTTICTGIFYDVDGNVAFIEISEAVLPRARRKRWSTEEFYDHFKGYKLCRYTLIDEVPAPPEMPTGNETYALMTRFGDKYNFTVSQKKGIVDILESGYSKAVILRDGVKLDEITLTDATKTFEFDRSVPGELEMYLEKADGTRSGSIYACVVQSSVAVTDYKSFATGMLPVTFEGTSGTPLYVQVGSTQSIFCSIADAKDNQATIVFPATGLALNKTSIRVAYQNEYGIYLSDWVPVYSK